MKLCCVELRHTVGKLRLVLVYRSPSISKEDDEKLPKAIADISRDNYVNGQF